MADILVTGGAGYIGAHACKALAAQGFRPVAFDNLVYGHEAAVRWGPLEIGDILDRARLDQLFGKYEFAGVMHFAAFTYVGESVADPAKYYRNNVGGMLSLLDALCAHQVKAMVFSSSCATYGTPRIVPITENEPLKPISPYGATKMIGERMIEDFAGAFELNFAALRYFNAAGADEDCEIGEDHDPETHLIPLALDAASGGRPLVVHGNDYPTPDGTCLRDYIHVADLADAHVLALRRLLEGQPVGALNLGTGVGVSVQQIIDCVNQVTGLPVPYSFGPRREGDPPALIADPSRAKELLGWSAKASDLQSIIRTAWKWRMAPGNCATVQSAQKVP